ncbi:MAG TPA: PaaI family thioesterase [Burkholderiaceae bacterium]|jgi:uncharacterized protein (TIGR00369 family)|nr:PaaI family thioesterase [Burkholderiaceae bacterium]HQR75265.1 PaaI family thioesterase [Burkholderiaceae bacterium]
MPTPATLAALQRAETAPDGVRDLIGYRFRCTDNVLQVVLDIDARHRNRAGTMHGGIAPLLMTVAGALAVYAADDTVDFAANTALSLSYLTAVNEGHVVAIGVVERLGGTLAHVSTRLVAQASGEALAVGACVYRLVRSSRAA